LFAGALDADRHRRFGSATPLGSHKEITSRKLRRLSSCTSTRDGIPRLLTLGIKLRSTTIELTDSGQTTLEFHSRACDRFIGHADLARHIGRLEFESLASQTRLL
jgi:hypothetical protein